MQAIPSWQHPVAVLAQACSLHGAVAELDASLALQ